MRQPAHEANGVGDEIAAAVVLEATCRRVERLEQAVAHRDGGVRKRVQKRRLADVGVARKRDGRYLGTPPLLASNVALSAQLLQSALEQRDPPAREPAGPSQVRKTTRPNAAPLP